jgi:hypothetical protein
MVLRCECQSAVGHSVAGRASGPGAILHLKAKALGPHGRVKNPNAPAVKREAEEDWGR